MCIWLPSRAKKVQKRHLNDSDVFLDAVEENAVEIALKSLIEDPENCGPYALSSRDR